MAWQGIGWRVFFLPILALVQKGIGMSVLRCSIIFHYTCCILLEFGIPFSRRNVFCFIAYLRSFLSLSLLLFIILLVLSISCPPSLLRYPLSLSLSIFLFLIYSMFHYLISHQKLECIIIWYLCICLSHYIILYVSAFFFYTFYISNIPSVWTLNH